MKRGMIKLSIFYPGGDDITFDMDYYLEHHISRVARILKEVIKKITVERGVAGGAPGSVAPYAVMTNLYFDNYEAVEQSFEPRSGEIMADVASFTNSKPFVQISEVVL